MINRAQLEQLAENIKHGQAEALANFHRAEGALELVAHLIAELEKGEAETSPDPEPTPEAK